MLGEHALADLACGGVGDAEADEREQCADRIAADPAYDDQAEPGTDRADDRDRGQRERALVGATTASTTAAMVSPTVTTDDTSATGHGHLIGQL